MQRGVHTGKLASVPGRPASGAGGRGTGTGHSSLGPGLDSCFLQGSLEGCRGHLWSHSPLGLKSIVDFGVLHTVFFGTGSVAKTVFKFNQA